MLRNGSELRRPLPGRGLPGRRLSAGGVRLSRHGPVDVGSRGHPGRPHSGRMEMPARDPPDLFRSGGGAVAAAGCAAAGRAAVGHATPMWRWRLGHQGETRSPGKEKREGQFG